MKETIRRLAALWCLATLWLWSGAAYAAAQDCKPWEEGCEFKAPEQVVSACGFGEVEAAPGRCCWRGQTWDDKALLCRGDAVCDAGGMELSGGACIPSTTWMVFHQQKCEAGYLGDCWRWARLAVPDIEEGGYALRGLPATALGPVLRPLCERGIKEACAHLGAVLTAEDFVLRPDDIPTLNAENQTPAYAEGLALLRSTCADGVADGCFALAEALGMGSDDTYKSKRLFRPKEVFGHYKRACALGHRRACARVADSAADNSAIKDEAGAEARLLATLKESHESCLRGGLASCRELERRWLPSEVHAFHHPPLHIPRAARERIIDLARLTGEETSAFRCRMGMVEREDTCGLAALLAQKPDEQTTKRALAFHDRRCDVQEGRFWHCSTPELRWRALTRGGLFEIFQKLSGVYVLDTSHSLPSKRMDVYEGLFGGTLIGLYDYNKFTDGIVKAISLPNTKTFQRILQDIHTACSSPYQYSRACIMAMQEARTRGDVSSFKKFRSKLLDTIDKEDRIATPAISSAEYWELRELKRLECEGAGTGCYIYAVLIQEQVSVLDAPGDEHRPLKAASPAEVRAALSRGCERFDARACEDLGRWLNDPNRYKEPEARREAAQAYWRACILGDKQACVQLSPEHLSTTQAARLDELRCLSASGPRGARCASYISAASALPLSTRRALCEVGHCEPLLEALADATTPTQHEERLSALLSMCIRSAQGAKERCEQLQRELIAHDLPALTERAAQRCERRRDDAICAVADAVLSGGDKKRRKRYAQRRDTMWLNRCVNSQDAACDAWLARNLPNNDKPIKDHIFLAARDACILSLRHVACERLWRLWQAQRVPQLSFDEGRKVGAMACFNSEDAKLCEEVAQRRLIGRPDTNAYEDVGVLLMTHCNISHTASCDALRQMHRQGQLVGIVRETFITDAWSNCTPASADAPECKLMHELSR